METLQPGFKVNANRHKSIVQTTSVETVLPVPECTGRLKWPPNRINKTKCEDPLQFVLYCPVFPSNLHIYTNFHTVEKISSLCGECGFIMLHSSVLGHDFLESSCKLPLSEFASSNLCCILSLVVHCTLSSIILSIHSHTMW